MAIVFTRVSNTCSSCHREIGKYMRSTDYGEAHIACTECHQMISLADDGKLQALQEEREISAEQIRCDYLRSKNPFALLMEWWRVRRG